MTYLDENNIVSIGPANSEGKEYTRMFFGYPYTAYDHTILVYHKKEIIQKQWKDVGAGQVVLQHKTSSFFYEENINKGFARLGFDILFKYDEEKGEAINIAKPDTTVLEVANTLFGTSRTALVMPSYEKCLESSVFASFLFGIALAHGKWMIKNDELFPVKITIPLTSSLLGKKEFFEKLTTVLHTSQIIHSVQYLQTGTYEVLQLTLHDVALLQQFVKWLNPIVKIAKISTFDYTEKVYNALEQYVNEQGISLSIKSINDVLVLQAD